MDEPERKLYRLVFTGGFGAFFLWSLLMLLGIIPILGYFFQFLFLKWLVRNTVLAPFGLSKDEVREFVERRKIADAIEPQVR